MIMFRGILEKFLGWKGQRAWPGIERVAWLGGFCSTCLQNMLIPRVRVGMRVEFALVSRGGALLLACANQSASKACHRLVESVVPDVTFVFAMAGDAEGFGRVQARAPPVVETLAPSRRGGGGNVNWNAAAWEPSARFFRWVSIGPGVSLWCPVLPKPIVVSP